MAMAMVRIVMTAFISAGAFGEYVAGCVVSYDGRGRGKESRLTLGIR
jgi:hypothetical protein